MMFLGILKNRFRCLLKERVMRYDPFKAGLFVNACCVLHNMCLTREVPLLLGDDDDFIPNEVQHEPNRRQVQNEVNIQQEGQRQRTYVVNTYFAH